MGNNVYIFDVGAEEQGMALHAFLRLRVHEGISAKALKRAIDAKCCRVNGKVEFFSSYALVKGDRVELQLATQEPRESQKQPLDILYEDEHLLICNKAAGVVSEPAFFPYPPIHRLDKETTGALILVKTAPMQDKMINLFQKREVHKEYLALVDGTVQKEGGKIDNFLDKKFTYEGQTVWGVAKTGEGYRAITFWQRLDKRREASFLLCQPVTGRTHQLRVHLSGMGHPILGDHQYCKDFHCDYKPQRHMLHAWRLSLRQPITGREISVTAPIPKDFSAALKSLEMTHPLEGLHEE